MNKTGEKQIGAWGFCAFSLPAILLLPQAGWETVLVVTLGSGMVAIFGRSVIGSVGWALSLPLILWNGVIIGKVAWEISAVYGTVNPLPGLLLLLLAAYSAKKERLPVVAAVVAFFLVGIYGILYLFAIPDIDISRLMPERETEIRTVAYGFMPLLLLYVYRAEERRGRAVWLGIGTMLAIGAAIITEGIGARDFYTAAKSVNLFGTMERLEPFVAAAATAGGFCFIGFLIKVNENLWECVRKEKKIWPQNIILLLSLAVCIVAPRIRDEVWALGTTLCWGLIPIITQFVVCKKKD